MCTRFYLLYLHWATGKVNDLSIIRYILPQHLHFKKKEQFLEVLLLVSGFSAVSWFKVMTFERNEFDTLCFI